MEVIMHEVSLNQVITDYLSGESIELTTYEDIRQSLARFLVEEKKYPRENIISKYPLKIDLGDDSYVIQVDFVIMYQDKPVMILAFCPGAVSTFITQYLCLARIFSGSPVPYVIVTDSMDASLMDVKTKKEICRGYHCFPGWEELVKMAENAGSFTIPPERKEKDKRVAYAMFALSDSCGSGECQV